MTTSTKGKPRKALPEIDRIMRNIEVDDVGCWVWQGSLTSRGYGVTYVGRRALGTLRTAAPHRVIYEHHRGPIPEGLVLDHLCENKRCCNPEHLEPVTHRENLMRSDTPARRNALKTHCPSGHPYDETNTIINSEGRRVCRQCRIRADRARRNRQR